MGRRHVQAVRLASLTLAGCCDIAPSARAKAERGELGSLTYVTGNIGLTMNGVHLRDIQGFVRGFPPRSITAWLSESILQNPRGPQYTDRGGAVGRQLPVGDVVASSAAMIWALAQGEGS